MTRIHRSTLTGLVVLGVLACGSAPALASSEGLGITAKFGGPGTGTGQLSLQAYSDNGFDSGVAVSSVGDVYVADTRNNRVEWFDSTGTYEGQFNGIEIDGTPVPADKQAPSKLAAPESIAIDKDPASPSYGDVYVAGFRAGTIDKFTATGEFLLQLSVGEIAGIATDPSGNVWVTSYERTTVTEFSNEAKNALLTSLPVEGFAFGIAVDSEDDFYIPYAGITKYSKLGTGIAGVCGSESCQGPVAIDPADNDLLVDAAGKTVLEYGPFGEPFGAPILTSKPNILNGGGGIAVGPAGQVYVADTASDEVAIVTAADTPEKPEVLAATEPKGKSAVLHGDLSPHSAPTKLEYYFEYNTGSSCTGGSKTPRKESEGLVSEEVTGLEPAAEYTYCLVTENNFGPSEPGLPQSFTTLPAPPEVISEHATTVEGEPGTLVFAAVINPDHSKQETTYDFEYSEQASGETLENPVTIAASTPPIAPEVYEDQEISSAAAELPTTATIYYRIVATNEAGTEKGKVAAYTKLPIVYSEASSGLTLTEATLEAEVAPDFLTAKYHFEYAASEAALTNGEGTTIPGIRIAGELAEQPVSAAVYGLRPNTPYYYRVVLENKVSEYAGNINKGHPIVGEPEMFTTESLPFVSTGEARGASRTSETLSGTVTPIDQPTTYYFEYITETGYQAALRGDAEEQADPFVVGEATAPLSLAVSAAPQAVGPIPASGLLPEETYHYRLVAKNEWGAEYGESHTFTTGGKVLPGVSTGSASAVSQNSATLSGTVSTNGLQTSYGFEIGSEPDNYGPATGLGSIGGAATEEVHVTLGELQPDTTYHYRVTATNADGTVQGEPETFTTPGFPTLISPPPSPPLVASPSISFPPEEKTTTTTTKKLTNAEKLKKALKTCKKDKSKNKRQKCEKQARKKYPTAHRKTSKKK